MTFLALLIKELRLRMRRERTIWLIVLYILLMGLIGWFFIGRFSNFNGSGTMTLNDIGTYLYMLLSIVQLFLIIFITPAFTATAINGEKERQTFDLLLCSRISAFSLIGGKLVAGLVNAFLLIAAAIPLFSLVFFFGGISPFQIISALLIFISTTLITGTFSLFCSTLIARPAVSTSVAYMACVLRIFMPLILFLTLYSSGNWFQMLSSVGLFQSPLFLNQPSPLLLWNPILALLNTYPVGNAMGKYILHGVRLSPWLAYVLLDLIAAALFFLLSVYMIKLATPLRLPGRKKSIVPNKTSANIS
ncbi:MAG: ABC transporter permease [Ktedonobacteraceae bacterium]|nr:ABC transporter permease [Ktedonobacteraceae bacterium]MBV9711116.1 ABC transporter permease [Ktedonobacteraceae bacterium]